MHYTLQHHQCTILVYLLYYVIACAGCGVRGAGCARGAQVSSKGPELQVPRDVGQGRHTRVQCKHATQATHAADAADAADNVCDKSKGCRFTQDIRTHPTHTPRAGNSCRVSDAYQHAARWDNDKSVQRARCRQVISTNRARSTRNKPSFPEIPCMMILASLANNTYARAHTCILCVACILYRHNRGSVSGMICSVQFCIPLSMS